MNHDDFPALHALSQEMTSKINPEAGRRIFSAVHSLVLAKRYGADYSALDYYHNPHLRSAHTMEAVNEILTPRLRSMRTTVTARGKHSAGYSSSSVVTPPGQAAATRRRTPTPWTPAGP